MLTLLSVPFSLNPGRTAILLCQLSSILCNCDLLSLLVNVSLAKTCCPVMVMAPLLLAISSLIFNKSCGELASMPLRLAMFCNLYNWANCWPLDAAKSAAPDCALPSPAACCISLSKLASACPLLVFA